MSQSARSTRIAIYLYLTLLTIPSLCSAVGLAQNIVSNTIAANAELFPWERIQLTDVVIDQLSHNAATVDLAKVVAFQSNGSDMHRNFTGCKTFPGDNAWPSISTWGEIDSLIGRSLIKTIPIASVCYNSPWGSKDAAMCNALVGSFQKFSTQYV